MRGLRRDTARHVRGPPVESECPHPREGIETHPHQRQPTIPSDPSECPHPREGIETRLIGAGLLKGDMSQNVRILVRGLRLILCYGLEHPIYRSECPHPREGIETHLQGYQPL